MLALRRAAIVAALALTACAQNGSVATQPSLILPAASPTKIQHVVIIFQENRSMDDLFNGFPGTDTVRSGYNSKGQKVRLRPVSLTAPYDLSHTHQGFETEYADGKMNGFNNESSGCVSGTTCIPFNVRAYGYVPHSETRPYFAMATQYTLADHMFQTNQGPSFPAHQYIVSGTSTIADGSPLRAAEQPFVPDGGNAGAAGGCDSPAGTLVSLINTAGEELQKVYPCFDRLSLMQLLDKAGLSWRYYQAMPGAGIWNAPDAVLHIRKSTGFASEVVAPSTQVFNDVKHGELADVVWVTPSAFYSDHAQSNNGSGPSWVAAVVNAIGESKFWNTTAIFVTWDDWGGWYDHVAPHQYNSYELGFRVPLIVISPYAKNHYISHVPHEFGSILKFTEKNFGLPSMHTTDERADDLSDCFDFSKPPTKFTHIAAKYPPSYFFTLPSKEPDD